MYYVYILQSKKTGKIYKGCTKDLKNRLKEHNSGHTQSTKADIPWKLIYCEIFTNKTDARREELFLKTGKGRERIKYLLQNTIGGFA
ncbi:MAG: GIY-YIG nuclease family protein [Patescibacteria group bacterium]